MTHQLKNGPVGLEETFAQRHAHTGQVLGLVAGVGATTHPPNLAASAGAQWTGVTTAVAMAWLECGAVDAVVVAGTRAGRGWLRLYIYIHVYTCSVTSYFYSLHTILLK